MLLKRNIVPAVMLGTLIVFSLYSAGIATGAANTLTAPAGARNAFSFAEVWSKYNYNETSIGLATPIIGGGGDSFFAPLLGLEATSYQRENETLDAGFQTTAYAVEEGNQADLNVTGGIKFSDTFFTDIVAEPIDFDGSSRSQIARQLGLLREEDLPAFGVPEQMQYFFHESRDMQEVQGDVAAAIDRTFTYADVNVTSAYLRVGVDYNMYQSIVNAMVSHDSWDEIDGMTNAQIVAVLDDVLPQYTLGQQLFFGNTTALQESDADKSNWALAQEFESTLGNDTDASLVGFSSDSGWIMLAMLSYILEFGITDITTSMVANGFFGVVTTEKRGRFQGMEMVYNQGSESADLVLWIDISNAAVGLDNNFFDFSIALGNTLEYIETVLEEGPLPLTFIIVGALIIGTLLTWMAGGGDLGRFYDELRKNKPKGKMGLNSVIFLLAYVGSFLFILNGYVSIADLI